jgi:uncharacterized integral membrane protein (TIGR00698 family)
MSNGPAESAVAPLVVVIGDVVPGVLLAAAVAVSAALVAPLIGYVAPIPPIVIALFIGMALNPLAVRQELQLGVTFCVKIVLRWAVALLGLRIALGEIAALGVATAGLVVVSMVVTVAAGFLFARAFGQTMFYGALAGAGTAVCGASATLATASVLPDYPNKQADVAFVVVAVNSLSTVAMLLYPVLCAWLGLSPQAIGVMLGATIHDVAQVAGAGYAVSNPVGNAAVIVKLFRVLLLFPVVVSIGWWFARPRPAIEAVKASVPVFALVFIALCIVNSLASPVTAIAPIYAIIKGVLVEAANWGLLLAIAALGLGTSFRAVAALGWRHIATVLATTSVILSVVMLCLTLLR